MSEDGNGWQSLYYDAVAELDPTALLRRIEAAQRAIVDRLDESLHGRNPMDAIEQQAIEDARRSLYFLKKHPAA